MGKEQKQIVAQGSEPWKLLIVPSVVEILILFTCKESFNTDKDGKWLFWVLKSTPIASRAKPGYNSSFSSVGWGI